MEAVMARKHDPGKLFIVLIVFGGLAFQILKSVPGWIWILIIGAIGIGLLIVIKVDKRYIASLPVCRGCGSRGHFVLRHRRIDGGPDRRYHYNPLVCAQCGTDVPPIVPTPNNDG
jgi:hypothetical protein